jgi:predicted Kef-type K+ transport protein
MQHDTPLIATIVAGLGFAFVFGAAAQRLRIPPLVGYLLAGVAAGPFTPGFVADQALAAELAEIGVILLMFGVGLHFSVNDLLSVRAIALPGAVVQIGVASDDRGRKTRTTEARDNRRGIPQGSPISPLLANLYMRRFVMGWRMLGLEQ